MPRFRQMKIDGEWTLVEVGCSTHDNAAPYVIGDTPDYQSPVDGKLVSGRKQRREDLKRTGCVEYDPGVRQDAERKRADNERQYQKQLAEATERTAYQLRDGMAKRETRINPADLFRK